MPAIGTVSGSFRILFLYDVAEEIDLDRLKAVLGAAQAAPPACCLQFERPPLLDPFPPIEAGAGRRWSVLAKYYEYGVITIELAAPFDLTWPELVKSAARAICGEGLDGQVAAVARECVAKARAAMIKASARVAEETYACVEMRPVRLPDGHLATASELIENYGDHIARILRREPGELSGEEAAHTLESRMSYHPADLVVVGRAAAVVCDTPSGAAPTLALLEHAAIQLLELKYYDDVLTRVLSDFYRLLEKRGGFFARWHVAREAERLGTIRLDVRELTERIDNSNKFLSDSYSARLYRMVAVKLGVPDYRKLVDDKLLLAADLYRFVMDRFHQGSAFVLELMIVVILIIDLIYLFWPRA